MKRKAIKRSSLALALALALPLAAFAREAIVVDDIGLQAGPDPEYPAITQLAAGTEVQVEGCIDAFAWCDVVANGDRGWVPGSYMAEDLDNQRVLVIDYGPRIGIPVVSFDINVYWNEHYRSRPFYTQRETFVTRRIQPHAPTRPSAVALSKVNVKVQGTAQTTQTQSGTQQTTQTARQGTASSTTQTQTQTHQQQTRQAAAGAQTETERAHAEARSHAQQPHTGTTGSTAQQQPHNAPPAAQSKPQTESERATAATRDNERNVPNVRADQREGTHGTEHPMPPNVQSGNQQQHQVASSKPKPPEESDKTPAKQQPKSDKDKDKGDKDHDHDHDH